MKMSRLQITNAYIVHDKQLQHKLIRYMKGKSTTHMRRG